MSNFSGNCAGLYFNSWQFDLSHHPPPHLRRHKEYFEVTSVNTLLLASLVIVNASSSIWL